MCVGGFAFVFVAQDLKDGKEYALKVCELFVYLYEKWLVVVSIYVEFIVFSSEIVYVCE